jgi:hypothetical protein
VDARFDETMYGFRGPFQSPFGATPRRIVEIKVE